MQIDIIETPEAHIPELAKLKINGVSPFNSNRDGVEQRLAEAHALLTLLSGAHNVCEEAGPELADGFDNLRHEISARALEGIGSLIALAQYHHECACAEDRARRAAK